jgi:hypothetical protein
MPLVWFGFGDVLGLVSDIYNTESRRGKKVQRGAGQAMLLTFFLC